MSERNRSLSRRYFLLSLGAGGAATAAAIATRQASQTGVPEKSQRPARGYRESAHVRNYYRTTKV